MFSLPIMRHVNERYSREPSTFSWKSLVLSDAVIVIHKFLATQKYSETYTVGILRTSLVPLLNATLACPGNLQLSKVDTTACFCTVDAGLKTVAGAKRFVPGTKLCLQPDIKPSIHPTRQKPARGDRSRSQSPLLPGLPDDLAIACLIRVPRVEHRKLRLVCKRWYRLLAGWRNPSTSLNGQLYALECKDGCKIRVYDEKTDAWSKHIDSKMHLGNSKALEAAALLPLNGKLCIIRNNMSISLVNVSKSDDASSASAEHLWETIAGKGQFKTLVTNFLSSLGRNRLKSHIVHCQVLQA
ncbi:hypothetical protein TEA_015833 [Camellia sinensis var. sinensis]|uniref:F-box domain-containing protein n=1 Tax=Camellia sinensis var. sinensis TaxID=542762 RepID=A0A4S4E743_CAMSN|nr:hypothetical protein TEA_015833 [Camellia sinensis var. sinensis]